MKRIYETIITIIASIALVGVVEINAAERFIDDVTVADTILLKGGYYEGATFAKNLTLNNVLIRNGALKDVLVVGNLILNGCFVADGVLDEVTVMGQKHIDDATVFFQDKPSTSHAGETFSGDVYIRDPVIGAGAYKGATFYGDLAISSIVVGANAFEGALIMGNLTISSFNIGTNAFQNIVLMGELSIEDPCTIISSYSFNNLRSLNAINLRLPSSLSCINSYAFRKANISAIDFDNSKKLKSIGELAFYDCDIHTLQFPITKSPLTVGQLAFGKENTALLTDKPRKFFLPLHVKDNFIHGTAYINPEWEGWEQEYPVLIEDMFSKNDSVFLWLDPNDLSSLPLTYKLESSADADIQKGNGKLFVPRGSKEELLSLLKPTARHYEEWGMSPDYFFPIYSYFKEENIIEIDMGEYPNYRSPGLFGDINADKAVDEADATMMIDVILGGGFMHRSDLNVDGSNDGTDVSILLETIHAGE